MPYGNQWNNALSNIGSIIGGAIEKNRFREQEQEAQFQKTMQERQLARQEELKQQAIQSAIENLIRRSQGEKPLPSMVDPFNMDGGQLYSAELGKDGLPPTLTKEQELGYLQKVGALTPLQALTFGKGLKGKFKNVENKDTGKIIRYNESNPNEREVFDAPEIKNVGNDLTYSELVPDKRTNSLLERRYKVVNGKKVTVDYNSMGKLYDAKEDENGNTEYYLDKDLVKGFKKGREKIKLIAANRSLAENGQEYSDDRGLESLKYDYEATLNTELEKIYLTMPNEGISFLEGIKGEEFEADANGMPTDARVFKDNLEYNYQSGAFDTAGTKDKKEKTEHLTYQILAQYMLTYYGLNEDFFLDE